MLNIIMVVVFVANAYLLFDLGQAWLSIGYGLNPWIAFPLSAMFWVGALCAAHQILVEHRHKAKQQKIIELSRKLS